MTPARWSQVRQIFEDALERPASDRTAYLRAACPHDTELRHEVETLLASHERSENFLATPAIQMNQIIRENRILGDDRDEFPKGYRLGPYEFERRIGRGGMGAVWLATRHDHEYQKKVAIKMVKPGMDSQEILRRFRTERQVLANLQHPNIAHLIDGGSTPEGLPYLVMEYVDGKPIDQYCEKGKRPISERLQLFRAVCAAVQFAHQNLVVHRDIKHSNILVTADGTPKLLDFGIAKLLRPDPGTFDPAQTRPGMRPMTIDYASPEQVMGEPITTASDVYSLGVLLFRLLTGKTPYGPDARTREALQQAICQTEPLRPSSVILADEKSTVPDATQKMEAIDESRTKARKRLRKKLTGDLDSIVLMALRKEPHQRYASAAQFSEDIGRYLAGEPVIARLHTPGYRISKFIQRNWKGMAAAALLAVAVIWVALRFESSTEQARAARFRAESSLLDTRHALIAAYLRGGETQPALDAARSGFAASPASALTRRDLAAASEAAAGPRLGSDRSGATALYRDAVTQFEAVSQMNTRDLDVQRDLMLAAAKLGMIEAEDGNVPGALADYGRALQAAQGLMAAEGSRATAETTRELYEITQRIDEISRSAGK